ncbi:hypothetical protein SMC26_03285 [Actinomadura fulvescens]|uniref:Translation initiation factor IF-2 n=1 Tax=Actinomadura fulvescens TaxID=46160 RepID=A0ABN3PWJ1_9ACTN
MSFELHAGNDDVTSRVERSASASTVPVPTVTIAPPTAEPPAAAPVFVDGSGRRVRTVRVVGAVTGAALVAYLAVVGLNLSKGAEVPFTPWPAAKTPASASERERDREPATGGLSPRPAGSKPVNGGSRDEAPRGGVPSNGPHGNPSAAPQPPAGSGTPAPSNVPSAVPTPAPTPPTATPAPSPSSTRPGKSHASPPAHGKKKKEQSG